MKLAIHEQKGSFSDRWIPYCKKNNIPYKVVNCYDTDIVDQLRDCSGLMWHWSQEDYRAQGFARQLIISVEKMGIKVFPNSDNCWHFDDKVGQKYLLEAIGAPLVNSYVFYDKKVALDWIEKTTFPKVFKLRGGAASINVKLIKNKHQARRLINRSFKNGFPFTSRIDGLRDRLWRLKRDKNIKAIIHVIKGFIRIFMPQKNSHLLPRQKGYIYFQEFIPNNKSDYRVVVIGNRAIAIRRYVRKNDFRASGSGVYTHNIKDFNVETIKIAFNIAKTIKTNSLAMDFIFDKDGSPLIVEMSYAYIMGPFYDNCPGYWDECLNWHNALVNPQHFIIEDFIKQIQQNA